MAGMKTISEMRAEGKTAEQIAMEIDCPVTLVQQILEKGTWEMGPMDWEVAINQGYYGDGAEK
jgi:hypothetical protein